MEQDVSRDPPSQPCCSGDEGRTLIWFVFFFPFDLNVLFRSASDKVLTLLPSFPVDKYELEASAFASFFVKNAKEGMCWPLQSRFNMPVKVSV